MEDLYSISSISRQGYHKGLSKASREDMLWQRIKEIVIEVRKDYPRISARKIHRMLDIKEVGVNRFEEFVSAQGLGVSSPRSFIRTTYSGLYYYPNLVNGIVLNGVNQLWVGDITYYITKDWVFYIVFILDVYSRRIVGFNASDNMLAINNQKALKMAFRGRRQYVYEDLIHHSDKGSQYGSTEYVDMLTASGITISMANTCLENPYAERINGIIKRDYLVAYNITSLTQLKKALAKSVVLYNHCPHGELAMMSPLEFEERLKQTPRDHHPQMQLYDFTKSKTENVTMGFKRHKTMKIAEKEKTVALQNKTTVNHFPGSAYSLEGCSPAEPSSASPIVQS
jgi:hypothetical protein